MKRIILLLTVILCFITVNGQDNNSAFLFDDFTDGIVILKNGSKYSVPLNYDLVDGYFLFIDKADKQEKQFGNPGSIGVIKVNNRSFVIEDNITKEVIQVAPRLYVSYLANLVPAPKNIAYGGTSENVSVDTYSYSSGNIIRDNRVAVRGIRNTYEAEFDGKKKIFNNLRSLMKAIPKNRKAEAEKYIKRREFDFNNVNQILDLVNLVNSPQATSN